MRNVKQLNGRAQIERATPAMIPNMILAMTVLACLSACGTAKWQETKSTHTGDPVMEQQVAPPRGNLEPGSTGYISSDRLRGLDNPDQQGEDAPVVLEKNDSIEIMDATPQGTEQLVKVRPKNTKNPGVPHSPIYVPQKYVADKPIPLSTDDISADRYVVVQNIATETLRVYEHCTETPGCANKLILETDMVVGQDTPNHELRTRTGVYRIESWAKFYEDNQRLYPSWMAPGAPAMPGAGQSLAAWTNPALIPKGYSNEGARGAFGWFTAKIGPNAGEQWTHGTWGLAADGDKFIQAVRQLKNDERIASHGCTRVENQAIALMHEILPAGTKVIKVYAREAFADADYSSQQIPRRTWDWTMTSEGAMTSGRKMSASKNPAGRVIDQGRYTPENKAHALSGNIYGVSESEMSGVFFVDEGRLENYKNPASIPNGGFGERNGLPSSVVARGTVAPSARIPLPPERPDLSDQQSDHQSERASDQQSPPLPPPRSRPVQSAPIEIQAPVPQPVERPVVRPSVPVPAPVRVAPVRAEPVQNAPIKIAPVKVAPVKIEPVQIAPPKTAAGTAAPKVTPVKAAPAKVEPVKVAPVAVAPVKTAPPVPTVPAATAKKSDSTVDDDPIADTGSASSTTLPVPHRPLKKKHAVQN